jgi:hypothetical protein
MLIQMLAKGAFVLIFPLVSDTYADFGIGASMVIEAINQHPPA